MLLKSVSHSVKDLDSKQGIVKAYANVYGNIDSDGDISMPGSFKKTCEDQKRKIRVFKDHDRYKVLGVPLEMDAMDSYGLMTTTKFNMEKEMSRDMFTDIQLMMNAGQDADLSVGVIPVKRDDADQRKVTEWKLKEYSFLSSWGANDKAVVMDIKSYKDHQAIIDIVTKAYDLPYSDTRLKKLEELLKSLEAGTDHSEPTIDAGADPDHSELTESQIIDQLLNTI